MKGGIFLVSLQTYNSHYFDLAQIHTASPGIFFHDR